MALRRFAWYIRQACFSRFGKIGLGFAVGAILIMELVCEKYHKKINSVGARCQHPTEYCKFRTACIIHFMSKDMAVGDGEAVEEREGEANGESAV